MELRQSLKLVKFSYIVSILVAVGIAVYWSSNEEQRQTTVWFFIVPAIMLFMTVVRHIKRRLVKMTISSDRLRYESGVASKSTRTIELAKIQDVRVDQSMMQRMLGIGNLSMETAGGGSRIEMDSIDRPQETADRILELSAAAHAGRTSPSTTTPPGAVS